jgi:heterodisulfide reductase subunit B
MTAEKLSYISEAGANCIVDICPFCHLQYDLGQKELGQSALPVLHLAQLYGLAFELERSHLGLEAQAIPVKL